MRRYLIALLLLMATLVHTYAQSGMTDQQVITYIMEENEKGTTQKEIVTRLMQRGVDMQQLQRVRRKVEQQRKNANLGEMENDNDNDNRLRTNNSQQRNGQQRNGQRNGKSNGKTTKDKSENLTTQRLKAYSDVPNTYDEDDPEFMLMQAEMGGLMPIDSIALLEEILEKQRKEKTKIFGHDIFNNDNLSFEPNMNIATPQDYCLGPGDVVIVDVYGASQETFNTTVSPDGDITIEGFGPVQVAGLTVAQANARLRSQLGARYSSSQVRLTVGQTKTILVNVMGEVKVPGT